MAPETDATADNAVQEEPADRPTTSADIGTLTAAMSQHAAAAMGLRRERQIGRAIKQMERAVDVCAGREADHPTLAVEGARARINLGALLSEADRHMEALVAIKEAQRGLDAVRAWAHDCGSDDAGVAAIGKEADALHCAAMMAEALEVERNQDEIGSKDMHKKLIAEANDIAERSLPSSHPVVTLAKRFDRASAVCAQPNAEKGRQGSRPSTSDNSMKLPAVHDSRSTSCLESPLAVETTGLGEPETRETEQPQVAALEIKQPNELPRTSSKTSESRRPSRMALRSSTKGRKDANGRNVDIFKEFIALEKIEKDARLAAKGGGQEDIKKNLCQKHRQIKMQLELLADDDLKEKRYTKTGHQVFMSSMLKENLSRSDPSLRGQSRKSGAAPEVLQMKKLNGLLYVKPATPEPVAKKKEPAIHADLAGSIGSVFKKPPANANDQDLF